MAEKLRGCKPDFSAQQDPSVLVFLGEIRINRLMVYTELSQEIPGPNPFSFIWTPSKQPLFRTLVTLPKEYCAPTPKLGHKYVRLETIRLFWESQISERLASLGRPYIRKRDNETVARATDFLVPKFPEFLSLRVSLLCSKTTSFADWEHHWESIRKHTLSLTPVDQLFFKKH